MGINTIRFWLRWGGLLFIAMGVLLFVVPRLLPVPERAALVSAEGRIVDISYERQDAKSSLPPSARLHVRTGDGKIRVIRVHPRRVAPADIAAFLGREARALHDDRGNAYELIIAGDKLIDYQAFAAERRETLAGIPFFGAGIALLGTLMMLIGQYLFGRPPGTATPTPPSPNRPWANSGGFGKR